MSFCDGKRVSEGRFGVKSIDAAEIFLYAFLLSAALTKSILEVNFSIASIPGPCTNLILLWTKHS